MDFKILDASAFYAGIPFASADTYHTTLAVYDEVSHIKARYGTISTLVEMGRLVVREPERSSIQKARQMATKTGDIASLSAPDISVIALAVELGGMLVTDDFAIANVAANHGIRCSSVMTGGIRTAGVWVHYCRQCKISFEPASVCPRCGRPGRKRLAQRKPASGPLDK